MYRLFSLLTRSSLLLFYFSLLFFFFLFVLFCFVLLHWRFVRSYCLYRKSKAKGDIWYSNMDYFYTEIIGNK